MKDCIFCKIVEGKLPCHKVYEDDSTLGFLDISPSNLGHTLVVTKKHYTNIFDVDDNELRKLIIAVKKVSSAMKNGLGAEGVNLLVNNEEIAGQLVFHIHFHIVPRFKDDNVRVIASKKKSYSDNEKEIVGKIRTFLK